ncbi:hypothetical protein SAMN05421740_103715 [Parapedobacter koreensis]|uniref:Uncharacterized protein n=1 Tax=Parapedobacter koreensis TaxID=332977 RepID=A0A1H7N0U3_9SPHI|nr:hypothetical protein SAMN05421740_103715 [Parapedobacter koreensis]
MLLLEQIYDNQLTYRAVFYPIFYLIGLPSLAADAVILCRIKK